MNELVLRAGQGDPGAKEELIRNLKPRIEKIVKRYSWIHGAEEEDLRQEAYMAIMEGLGRVDVKIGSSSEYLLKFARWRLLDCLKKIMKRKEDDLKEGAFDQETTDYANVTVELLNERLDEIQKQIILLLVQGYTWREIGKLLGFTAANVAHHLKKIRQIYGNEPVTAKGIR